MWRVNKGVVGELLYGGCIRAWRMIWGLVGYGVVRGALGGVAGALGWSGCIKVWRMH